MQNSKKDWPGLFAAAQNISSALYWRVLAFQVFRYSKPLQVYFSIKIPGKWLWSQTLWYYTFCYYKNICQESFSNSIRTKPYPNSLVIFLAIRLQQRISTCNNGNRRSSFVFYGNTPTTPTLVEQRRPWLVYLCCWEIHFRVLHKFKFSNKKP